MHNKNNAYTLTLVCNTQYWSDLHECNIDMTEECQLSQDELERFFNHCDIRNAWHLGGDFLYKSRAGELVETYKYEFDFTYEKFTTKEKAIVELTIYTDALGRHLEEILESVRYTTSDFGIGFGEWLSEIGYQDNGWNKIAPEKLVECIHKKHVFVEFSQKGGDLVEICRCRDCEKVFYKVVERM